ncbi:MAG: hypothetical protein ABSG93_16035 [Solirubrobacteraceae bacterium]|jgi:hypothetical protein
MRLARRVPRGDAEQQAVGVVPVVLAQVLVTVDESGRARVRVDGIEHPDGPVDRERLGGVLAGVADAADGPVRVEIHEPDGTSYADILQPPRRRPAARQEKDAPTPARGPVLRAEGFAPGETVLVAVLTMSVRADADGTVCLLALPNRPRRVDELMLLGLASRRTVFGRRIPDAKPGRWRR